MSQKNEAISKNWHVYYSFRSAETNKLVRMSNINRNANQSSSKTEPLFILKYLRNTLKSLLEKKFNTCVDNNLAAVQKL